MTSSSDQNAAPKRGAGATTVAVIVACLALFWGVFAAGLAARAVSDAKDGRSVTVAASGSAAAAAPVPVALSEFAIAPAMVMVPEGGKIAVKNTGSIAHNLAVQGHDLRS